MSRLQESLLSSTDTGDYWNQYGDKGDRGRDSYLEVVLKNMDNLADAKCETRDAA